jgi:sialate O-acetylesterase
MKLKIRILLGLIIFNLTVAHAAISVSPLLGDHMVLQRNSTVKLWGKALPHQKLSIITSWNNQAYKITSDDKGEWLVKVITTDAGGPFTVQIAAKAEKMVLNDILLGDVWLCSGQSNMEMPINGFPYQPIIGSQKVLLEADNKNIRLYTVRKNPSATPLDSYSCVESWKVSDPESVSKFSALGYFYAKILQEKLNIPIGLIFTSYGGTRIESWMSKATIDNFPEALSLSAKEERVQNRPAHLYNGMIHPLLNYHIKGAIWYQGESNRNNYWDYAKLLTAMVSNWRAAFNIGDFPFYYVQIAPYSYGNSTAINTTLLREEQLKASAMIPNSGVVCTQDVGNESLIHPAEKQKIAERLSLWALSETYGIKGLNYKSPVYKSMEISGDTVTLNFTHTELGLTSYDKSVDCFEIAGSDGVFYPAQMTPISNNFRKVQIKSNAVKNPVAVRYAYQNFPKTEGYLYNNFGLPVFPFSTISNK